MGKAGLERDIEASGEVKVNSSVGSTIFPSEDWKGAQPCGLRRPRCAQSTPERTNKLGI